MKPGPVLIALLLALLQAGAALDAAPGPAFDAGLQPPAAGRADVSQLPLLRQGRIEAAEDYQFALRHQARIARTPDDRSFYLHWRPAGARPGGPLIVTLHGARRWAFEEFAQWQEIAARHRCELLAIQWWFGDGDGPRDYYTSEQLYPVIATLLQGLGTRQGSVLLHGFDRGSSETFALTLLDQRTASRYFALTVANAGPDPTSEAPSAAARRPAPAPNPLYADLSRGRYGTNAFAGTHWALYAGSLDEYPERNGPPAMNRSATWLRKLGGTIDLFREDPRGDHRGFYKNTEFRENVMQLFRELQAPEPSPAPGPVR